MISAHSTTGIYRTAAILLLNSLLSTIAFAAPSSKTRLVASGMIITPAGSQDLGPGYAHTNIELFVPKGHILGEDTHPSGIFETSASLACLYRLVKPTSGCNPQTLTASARGGSKVVVIVDAYHSATAVSDLTRFSAQFGLSPITPRDFQIVYATGTEPAEDPTGGWKLAESLDLEMVHALAPQAKIILVEAASNPVAEPDQAEVVAAGLAAKAGGGEVSNSWGGGEVSIEETYESIFTGAKVVFFTSAGDSPGVLEPSVLSNVVAVRGTTVHRDLNGNYLKQSVWMDTGGGFSQYVHSQSYQSKIGRIAGDTRAVPDVAFDADPASGVWIYDTTPYRGTKLNWQVVGGTSAGTPAVAAIVNNAGNFTANSVGELTTIYADIGRNKDGSDTTSGDCQNGYFEQLKGWDACTGVGPPHGRDGK